MIFVSILFHLSLSKKLQKGDIIQVKGNKAYPKNDPLESYDYSYIPFCPTHGQDKVALPSFLAQVVGNRLQETATQIEYLKPVESQKICKVQLTNKVMNRFQSIIQQGFVYQIYVGKLPAVINVGNVDKDNNTLLYSHLKYRLLYNDEHVVEVEVYPDNLVHIKENQDIQFTYTVEWTKTTKKYRERFDKYCDLQFYNHPVRKYAMYNAIILTTISIVFLIFILTQFLWNDFRRYERESGLDQFESDFKSEQGWKMVHADVFRVPSKAGILATFAGAGSQLLSIIIGVIIASLLLRLHFRRQSLTYVSFFLYSVSSFINGYVSGGMYKKFKGRFWMKQLLASSLVLPLLFAAYNLLLSVCSIAFGSAKPLHFPVVLAIFIVFIVVVLPLTYFGGIMGRHWFVIGEDPCRIGLVKRVIPTTPFYLTVPVLGTIVGAICFAIVVLEVYYIFVTFWYQFVLCTWGPLLVIMICLILVVSCATMVCTYARLNAENYQWQWASFFIPFGVSGYIFLYSIYFYIVKVFNHTTLQAIHFFIFSGAFSVVIGSICGFIGFAATSIFIQIVFKSLKTD